MATPPDARTHARDPRGRDTMHRAGTPAPPPPHAAAGCRGRELGVLRLPGVAVFVRQHLRRARHRCGRLARPPRLASSTGRAAKRQSLRWPITRRPAVRSPRCGRNADAYEHPLLQPPLGASLELRTRDPLRGRGARWEWREMTKHFSVPAGRRNSGRCRSPPPNHSGHRCGNS
jgi:hypothetical protein